MSTLYTAGDVMDDAAALLNDAQQEKFDYTVQLPFLKMVMRDIQNILNLNGFQLNLISEYEVVVLANATTITYPDNFFMPISLSERRNGSTDNYTPMSVRANVNDLNMNPGASLGYWDWRHNCINVLGATGDRQVRLYYWRSLLDIINAADEDTIGDIRGGQNLLSYYTAAMCAQFVGQNPIIAQSMRQLGGDALDVFLGLVAKNNQGLRKRRKPFRVRGANFSPLFARIPTQ